MIITIKVFPQSGKQQLVIDKNGNLKCYLKSPPEDGKANKELITFFAKTLKIPATSITILLGKTSRQKTIKIDQPITQEMFMCAFDLEKQYALL